MIHAKVRRVGSSLGVLLPKKVLDDAGIQEGDTITLPTPSQPAPRELYGIWRERPVRLDGGGE